MSNTTICPYCGHTRLQRIGHVGTVAHGLRQRHKCARCYRTFYADGVARRPVKTAAAPARRRKGKGRK